jgi:uncharacterized protein (DUF849 family)
MTCDFCGRWSSAAKQRRWSDGTESCRTLEKPPIPYVGNELISEAPSKVTGTPSEAVCICLAPTGMVPTKASNPNVPVHPDEIIAEVLEAAEAGVTYVHLHARDSNGMPTLDADRYGAIIEGIRRHNQDIVICVSLSGRLVSEPEKRILPLNLVGELKPDMASLTLSSLNFIGQASVNAPQTVEYLATEMLRRGVKPELEVFDLGMVNYAKVLIKKGLLQAPYYFNVLLGNIATAQLSTIELGAITALLPEAALWSLAGIGDAQLGATTIAIGLGAGIRIGLEDANWFDRAKTRHASNMALIKRARALMELNQRRPMSSQELRSALRLRNGHGSYGVAAA